MFEFIVVMVWGLSGFALTLWSFKISFKRVVVGNVVASMLCGSWFGPLAIGSVIASLLYVKYPRLFDKELF